MTITIRDLAVDDEEAWRAQWRGYCDFYETRIPGSVTDATWRCLMDADSPLFGLVACDGPVIGIVNCVLHPVTWSERPACYLEDLFVAPEARRKGAGRALIQAVLDRGQQMGWYRVYWMTKRDNRTARALYDKLAGKTDWVRYHVALGKST
ncbi:MAG: GNAT family N-acetyltransferase [Rhodospirillales bacterium]|nr:GNAT family N-acetyltransferase [Rhodospirillales bacterium]MBI2978076.1 GNAT family N-acetyltransferase [Rhodospirillales bacterium]